MFQRVAACPGGIKSGEGKDAFHRVPDFTRNEWDAVERTGVRLILGGNVDAPYFIGLEWWGGLFSILRLKRIEEYDGMLYIRIHHATLLWFPLRYPLVCKLFSPKSPLSSTRASLTVALKPSPQKEFRAISLTTTISWLCVLRN